MEIEARCLAFFSSAAAAAVSKYHFNANFELMLPLSLSRSLPYCVNWFFLNSFSNSAKLTSSIRAIQHFKHFHSQTYRISIADLNISLSLSLSLSLSFQHIIAASDKNCSTLSDFLQVKYCCFVASGALQTCAVILRFSWQSFISSRCAKSLTENYGRTKIRGFVSSSCDLQRSCKAKLYLAASNLLLNL